MIEEASGGVAASPYREEGPEDEIVELGEELCARLIVVSDQAAYGVSRLLMGSLFDALIRRAKRPAMVVC